MRSMIIGEDFPIRELVSAMLEPFGPCVAATSSNEALDKFSGALSKKAPFDLIVCDLYPTKNGRTQNMMPTICAMRTLEKQARIPAHGAARLLILAAFRASETVRILEGLQPAVFLRKPFDDSALFLTLHRMGLIESPIAPEQDSM